MRTPPDGQIDHQEPAVQVIVVSETAAFNHAASTLLILKRRLDSHAHGVFPDPFMRSRLIGNQKPRFLVSWFPARAEPDFKRMLFPQQNPSIPLIPFFLHTELAWLPILIPMANLSAEPFLLFDAQDVMPSDVLAQFDQVQATESPIGQQGTVLAGQIWGHLLKE